MAPRAWSQAVDQHRSGLYVATEAGATCSQSTLSAASSIASSRNIPVWVPTVDRSKNACTWSITSNMTPSTALVIPEGARLDVAAGVTLTLNACPFAGRYRIFGQADGAAIAGTVAGLADVCEEVPAEWFGVVGDDATENAEAFNAAFAQATQSTITLGPGIFRVGSAITAPTGTGSNWTLRGAGQYRTTIKAMSGYTAALMEVGHTASATNRWKIHDLTFDCVTQAEGTIGLKQTRTNEYELRNVGFTNCDDANTTNGATEAYYYEVDFEGINRGVVFSNANDFTTTVVKFFGGRWRRCEERCVEINGSHVAGSLVRELWFYGPTFDGNATVATNPVCFYIREAEQIHVLGGHIEACAPHVDIADVDTTNPARFITFEGINWGNLDEEDTTGIGLTWASGSSLAGEGSWIRSSLFTGMTLQFNQARAVEIRDIRPSGASVNPQGNYRLCGMQSGGAGASAWECRQDETLASWVTDRWTKQETQHSLKEEMFITGSTPNATQTTLYSLDVAADLGYAFKAHVVGFQVNGGQIAAYAFRGVVFNVAAELTSIVIKDVGTDETTIDGFDDLLKELESTTSWNALVVEDETNNEMDFNVIGDAGLVVYWLLDLEIRRISVP